MPRTFRQNLFRWGRLAILVAAVAIVAKLDYGQLPTVSAGSSVTGIVKDPLGTAVADAQVNFWGPSGNGSRTDATGHFTVSLNPGHYNGQAIPPVGSAYGPSTEAQFDVLDGQTTNLTFTLTTVQMRGKFKKADGTGVRGGINVFNADFTQNVHSESDENGNYVLGGLPAGTYTAQPMAGFDVTGLVAPDPIQVTLTTNSVITQDFTFTAAAKTITGKVAKSDGSAVAGACVNANKMSGQGWASSNSDSSGNYTLSVSGGSWSVQVNPCAPQADWIYNGPQVMIDFAQDTTTESKTANFTVTTAGSSVAGTVTDQTGATVTSGSIDFRTQEGAGTHAEIASNGTYSARLTGGTYNVFFWSQTNAYSLPQTQVTLGDSESKTLNLVVQAKTAHIKGTVKDASSVAAPNVMVNAWEMTGPGGKPGSWGNARSGADGSFDMLVTPGTYGLNIGTEPNSQYVWANPSQIQVTVPSATSTITPTDNSALNFVVSKADATITGKLTAGGQALNNAPLCVYARPVGAFNQSCNPVQPNGTFSIKVSSAGGTSFEMGCFSPPNMPFSCPQAVAVTIVANGTVTKDLDLTMNNSSIVGQLYDQSGFPLTNCESFRGGRVFADNPGGNGAHYEGEIGTDCKYKISLVAGVYFMNSFFPPESGAMNAPPGAPVQVFNNQSVQKNIMVAKADASVTVKLLDQNGNGTQGYIMVDNNEEINMSREGNVGPGPGDKKGKSGADLGFGKKFPCNANPDDFDAVIKCCSNTKNKEACAAFEVPDGPNGCKNLWSCVQQCAKDPQICKDAKQGDQNGGPKPGEGPGSFTGPGGCKSETECQKYCSDPAHFDECSKFKPPESAQSVVKISSKGVRAKGESATSASKDKGPGGFDKGIHSSGPTDPQGNATIQVLSGHKYKVCAGLPPESNQMPPKCQTADLTTSKSASVVLQLRGADAQLSGTVKMPDGTAATRCFVHAWAEDGSFSGQPCSTGGTYKLNLTADTTWHYGADSMDGSKFYRSEEGTLVVTKGTKSYTKNIELKEGNFEIPQPVTANGDCSSPLVLSMTNGAKITVPAGALSTSTTGQCSCTATPTIDLISTKSNQPQGAGYTVDCRDENGAQVTKLNSSATVTVPYKLSASEEGTSVEDALKPVLFQSDTQSYKTVDSYTLDKTNDLITFSVEHFSAYTVSNSSGASSKSAALKTVTTSTAKKTGYSTIKVGSKSVTPFNCRGSLSYATKSVNGTQLIAVGTTCNAKLKVYNTSLKLKKQLSVGSPVNTVSFADVTSDGKADIVVAPASGSKVLVVQPGSKYKTSSVSAPASGKLTAAAIDFRGSGIPQLVAGVVANGRAGKLTVYKYKSGRFSATSSSYASYLSGSGGTISLSVPKPKISALSKKTFASTSTRAKFPVTGKNFTPDTSALVGTVGGKVTFKSTKKIEVTFDASQLGAGSYTLKLTNPGGLTASAKSKITVQ